MVKKGQLKLGPDGQYRMVEEDTEQFDTHVDAAEHPENAESGADDHATSSDTQPRSRRPLTTISSSISGSRVGDDVAAKRANLLHAQGKPQVGRRESPEPYDPRPTRLMYAKGLLAGLIVVLVVCAIVVFAGMGSTIS